MKNVKLALFGSFSSLIDWWM